jgi:hypothetical protein
MKITIGNIDRSAILFGDYFTGAALGAVVGPQVVKLSPTWCALVGGVLILFCLPPTLLERFLNWGLVGTVGLLNLVLLVYIFLSRGDGIMSLLIVAAPLVLLTLIASLRG